MASPLFFFDVIIEFGVAGFFAIGCFLYFAIASWARFSGTPRNIMKTLPFFVFLLAVVSRYFYADTSFAIVILLPFAYVPLLDELSNQSRQKYGYGILALSIYICTLVVCATIPSHEPPDILGTVGIGATILTTPSVLTAVICSVLWNKMASKTESKIALENS